MKIIAAIPARAGSKRLPDKNIKCLNGYPLMAYTINTAIKSNLFQDVILCTDSEKYADIGKRYGASVPYLRDHTNANSKSADIQWVNELVNHLDTKRIDFDVICILRPTNPFRKQNMLQRAFAQFKQFGENYHSLRAIQLVSEHPGKMWKKLEEQIVPILPYEIENIPWHSNQTAALPELYVQNASLEIIWKSTIKTKKSIAGSKILGFQTDGYEGFDINYEVDFLLAETLIREKYVVTEL